MPPVFEMGGKVSGTETPREYAREGLALEAGRGRGVTCVTEIRVVLRLIATKMLLVRAETGAGNMDVG